MNYKLNSEFKPTGDQPQAIEKLKRGLMEGEKFQTLLGVTGSGKTFTIANVLAELNRPANLMLSKYCQLADEIFNEVKAGFGQ